MMYPKYALGNSSPHDEMTWVVRLRDPFMLALVEPMGLVGMRLHCWPPDVKKTRPEGKITKLCRTMASIWAEDVEQLPGLPSQWDYVFREQFHPPPFLMIDNYHSHWSGILRIKAPRLIATLDNIQGEIITEVYWLDDPDETALDEAAQFLEDYLNQEDITQ